MTGKFTNVLELLRQRFFNETSHRRAAALVITTPRAGPCQNNMLID